MIMLWRSTFYILVTVEVVWLINGDEAIMPAALSCQNPKGLFEDLTITSFIDKNRYIRLNISWANPKANFSHFGMMIETNCSSIYGDLNVSVDANFLIKPNMETMAHPAEPLMHGCKYDFDLFARVAFGNETCTVSQIANYKIPDCVGEVCECGAADAPFVYTNHQRIDGHSYTLIFNKTNSLSDLTLEEVFDKVWYTSTNTRNTVTMVQPEHIRFDNTRNKFNLTFDDFQEGNSYKVNVDLLLDNCKYPFNTIISVTKNGGTERSRLHVFFYLTAAIGLIVLLSYILLKTKPQLFEKLKNYVPFFKHELPVHYTANSLSNIPGNRKECINTQYTPLEFSASSRLLDEFEIPRNKITLMNEIGGGAFGKVFKAEVYNLNNKPGYMYAAAKLPIQNAPPEETADFLAEIEMMKKITCVGGHPNVIKMLACVTIEFPYIMVMELVPNGCLKSYLSNMRKLWDERKERKIQKNHRHFFPDYKNRNIGTDQLQRTQLHEMYNMIVENYLPDGTIPENDRTLQYTDLAFEDYTGSTVSSETNSYITPDAPKTPSTPGSLFLTPPVKDGRLNQRILKISKPTNKFVPACLSPQSPLTPYSKSSSGLPSGTGTLLTPLESLPATPLLNLIEEDTEEIKPVLDSKQLQSFALQIANGMAFLESVGITHRDLAARNILIGENKLLKISDFGMARVGVYVNSAQKRQPLRWMAPEAIESRTCNNKTDVWSFGVVLWEIGTLGAFPYKSLSNDQVIAHILQGRRLERPETCTDQVYDLMQKCWQKNPEDRPRFEDIAKQLDANNGKIYVDFSKLSPKYVFPPTQDESA
uniref:Protein kinase domain-containing protein n=1 Tax=Dendroctonus ponderosae TaxID=77166 RepID=A0AAR5P6A6_DENPD